MDNEGQLLFLLWLKICNVILYIHRLNYSVIAQRALIAKMTSYGRRCDIITSHRRKYDVIFTSCARWNRLTSISQKLFLNFHLGMELHVIRRVSIHTRLSKVSTIRLRLRDILHAVSFLHSQSFKLYSKATVLTRFYLTPYYLICHQIICKFKLSLPLYLLNVLL